MKDKVDIIVGDVTNAEQVSNAVADRDAVVVVLGTRYSLSNYYILYPILIFQCNVALIFISLLLCRSNYHVITGHEKYYKSYEKT